MNRQGKIKLLTADSGLTKVAVHCSGGSFVVNHTLVLRINPDSYRDGENRHLRQTAKCCTSLPQTNNQ